MTYENFFETLTGHRPFPYQARLANGEWPGLIDVPTGLGKTAAVVVAWLWRRLQDPHETPRRLVYCLPMRVLVHQTVNEAASWCRKAAPEFGGSPPEVFPLMGGDYDDAWSGRPAASAILVGTQDMLLSRALNRGYAMSRYRWPMSFGLMHSDALWVFDETQLMGVGLETSAQLEGLRQKLGVYGNSSSVWMSATLGQERIATIDHPAERTKGLLALETADHDHALVDVRLGASKPIAQFLDASIAEPDGKPTADYATAVAEAAAKAHRENGGLTLVLVNRVNRAQEIFSELWKVLGSAAEDELGLVHSRFRPADREKQEGLLVGQSGMPAESQSRIFVATQAIEAGVDVSARTMLTELAPWPSLVQRFGRLNRYGTDNDRATALWIDIDTEPEATGVAAKKADGRALPYSRAELDDARTRIQGLEDVGPGSLSAVHYDAPAKVRPILRRRDLLDLFDTTPDLAGNDLDISQFIRDDQDTDIQVYWQIFEDKPSDTQKRPERGELCRVTVPVAKDFFKRLDKRSRTLRTGATAQYQRANQMRAWWWNPLEEQWVAGADVVPGRVFLLHPEAGGYSDRLGWTGDLKDSPVADVRSLIGSTSEASLGRYRDHSNRADPQSGGPQWLPLVEHVRHVLTETSELVDQLPILPESARPVLETAAAWHDVGKAHTWFQFCLVDPADEKPPEDGGPWGKSNHTKYVDRKVAKKQGRGQFRHELASALAWLGLDGAKPEQAEANLIAFLIAAHHGKVRMSIRSLPGETGKPREPDTLFARGVFDGDVIPSATLPSLPSGRELKNVRLDLGLMRMGKGSWLDRTLSLRDDPELGPFRLAFLEAVLRSADQRASRKERLQDEGQAYG